jgi:hypothetical protein
MEVKENTIDDPFESIGAAVLALLEELKLTKYNLILGGQEGGRVESPIPASSGVGEAETKRSGS